MLPFVFLVASRFPSLSFGTFFLNIPYLFSIFASLITTQAIEQLLA